MDQTERRAAKRFWINLPGTATFDVDGKEAQKEVLVTQISAFSVYFESDICPDISASVKISLPMEESETPFQGVGSVLRVDQLENTFGCTLTFEKAPNF
jgi:hypothetical protein